MSGKFFTMRTRPDTWLREHTRKIADCRVFTVNEHISKCEDDGREADFYVIDCPDWVNVVAMTETREIVLIEQFRHGVEETILEIPGGMIDTGEDLLTAAKRELAEETGYISDNWELLGTSLPNPAIQTNKIYHYLAKGCRSIGETGFDEHESISTLFAGSEKVKKWISEGKISHSLVLAAFFYLTMNGYE